MVTPAVVDYVSATDQEFLEWMADLESNVASPEHRTVEVEDMSSSLVTTISER